VNGLWLGAFLVLSVMAVVTARGIKWKLLNIAIILGFVAVGLGIGAAMGAWGGNMEIGGLAAVPLAVGLGAADALGCWRQNKMREKKSLEVRA
jgi:predicted RND superfamily exporter protein